MPPANWVDEGPVIKLGDIIGRGGIVSIPLWPFRTPFVFLRCQTGQGLPRTGFGNGKITSCQEIQSVSHCRTHRFPTRSTNTVPFKDSFSHTSNLCNWSIRAFWIPLSGIIRTSSKSDGESSRDNQNKPRPSGSYTNGESYIYMHAFWTRIQWWPLLQRCAAFRSEVHPWAKYCPSRYQTW